MGVPRVFEKIFEKLKAKGAESGWLKKTVVGWAKDAALWYHQTKLGG